MKYNKEKIFKDGRTFKHGSGPRDRQLELQSRHDEELIAQIKSELLEQMNTPSALINPSDKEINDAVNKAVLDTKISLEKKFNKLLEMKDKEIKELKTNKVNEEESVKNVISLKSASVKNNQDHKNKSLEDSLKRLKLELNTVKKTLVETKNRLEDAEDKIRSKEELITNKNELIKDLKDRVESLKSELSDERQKERVVVNVPEETPEKESSSKKSSKKERPKMDKAFIDPSEDPLYKVETHITIDPTENERIVINEKVDKLKSLIGKLPNK